MTLKEVNCVFRFYNFSGNDVVLNETGATWDDKHFWRSITGRSTYNPTREKASPITHPAIKVFQRFIAGSMNGRGDGGNNCPKKDVTVLAASLKRKKLNVGAMLMHHMAHVGNKGGGAICIGGIVTFLAKHFGVNLSSL